MSDSLPPFKVGALVLAAGFSRRYGGSKLTANITKNITVLEATLSKISKVTSDILVVSRPEISQSLTNPQIQVLNFSEAEKGMGASLSFGISHVENWDAALICLADMPHVKSSSYQLLAQLATPDTIVMPQYGDKMANPVAFGSRFFDQLQALNGDSGGKRVVKENPDAVKIVSINDEGLILDIDRPTDLEIEFHIDN